MSAFTPSAILKAQNQDGGWPYRQPGISWTEPTAYALLALAAARGPDVTTMSGGAIGLPRDPDAAVVRGFAWLERCLQPDGSFAPNAVIAQGAWVTALAVLAATRYQPRPTPAFAKAVQWLARQTAANSRTLYRLRSWMLGNGAGEPASGWSWYPNTSAWVIPTAFTILALEQARKRWRVPVIRP